MKYTFDRWRTVIFTSISVGWDGENCLELGSVSLPNNALLESIIEVHQQENRAVARKPHDACRVYSRQPISPGISG